MRELIRKLVETYGPSGFEERIRETIRAEVEGLADGIEVTPMGSLVAHKGDGNGERILLAAHMDEIGVMASHVDEKGFLRFTSIGGVSPLTCIGGRVIFEDGTQGVIGVEQKRDNRDKTPKLDQLYIDVGATSKEDVPVGVGDAAGFVRPFTVQGQRLVAKSMDDRIGCAILIEVMRQLDESPNDIYFVFTSQEEVGLRGARTAAFGIEPDLAIAVDVTGTGDTPESYPMAVELGQGPAVKVQDSGMIAHPKVRDLLVEAAEAVGAPYQMEVLSRGTTDAAAMQITRAGVPAGTLSIPCRYVHSPSEMVDENDVENAVKVLVEALGSS